MIWAKLHANAGTPFSAASMAGMSEGTELSEITSKVIANANAASTNASSRVTLPPRLTKPSGSRCNSGVGVIFEV